MEVLDKREVPSGSWWCAEIISGNEQCYTVKYDSHSEGTDVTIERVPRKAIRPSPPSVMSPRSWVSGDIVEVYEKNSWKVAEVSRVVGVNYFLVRLLGLSRELWAHMSDLRMRLVWEDDKWVVIQKEGREYGNEITTIPINVGEFSHQMPQSCVEVKTFWVDDGSPSKYDGNLKESCWAPVGIKKRKPCLYSPQIDTCPTACKKMRFVEETRKKCRLLRTPSSHLLEKAKLEA